MQSPTKIGNGSKLLWIALLAMALFWSLPSFSVISQVSKADLNLKGGHLSLTYFKDEVRISDGSMATLRETGYSINLLSPLKLFSKKKCFEVVLDPLDYTYVRIFGDPDDFGLFSMQAICHLGNVLMVRWFFQELNVNTAQMNMGASYWSGSLVISSMISNQLPWLHQTFESDHDEICHKGSPGQSFLASDSLKNHAEFDPTGIYRYKYDGKQTMRISWDPNEWYDKVERDALKLSQEIRDMIRDAKKNTGTHNQAE